LAVFVDGCFWHNCPHHGTLPKANREWWRSKFETNSARDAATNKELVEAGWLVLRVWEHDDMRVVADRIEGIVRSRVSGSGAPIDVGSDVKHESLVNVQASSICPC
jgi:DNA mismatch endonuclease (patch repair protein)